MDDLQEQRRRYWGKLARVPKGFHPDTASVAPLALHDIHITLRPIKRRATLSERNRVIMDMGEAHKRL